MREANLMEQPLTAAQQQSARLHGAKRHRAENVPLTADPFLSAIDARMRINNRDRGNRRINGQQE